MLDGFSVTHRRGAPEVELRVPTLHKDRSMRTRSQSVLRNSAMSDLVSVRTLMLPVLVIYGCLVNPLTGHGGLPCIWRLCFGFECPGCGLSRADALFVRGSFGDALALNWLIVPVWLVAIYSFVSQVFTVTRQRRATHG
jgi:hypothetical protein